MLETDGDVRVGPYIDRATDRLSKAGVETPDYDAAFLVAHALALPLSVLPLHRDATLSAIERQSLDRLIERRCRREPATRIVGVRGFWTFDLAVTPDVLDPRPDTETVVEAVLAAIDDRAHPYRILDLGTGSGAILLALLSELPHATAVGTDISPAALLVARANADRLGLAGRSRWICTPWWAGLAGTFDVIVSNPPYIATGALATLPPEVQADPLQALDGGSDGFVAYRAITSGLARALAKGGVAAFEVGQGQAAPVAALLADEGFTASIRRDLGGIERCVWVRAKR